MTYHQRLANSVFGIRARIVLPLTAICLLLASVGGWLILGSHAIHSREHVETRAAVIAHAVAYLAESSSDVVELQRFIAAMSAEKGVKLIVVSTGEPLTVVASSRVDWVGLSPSELPNRNLLAQNLNRAIETNEQHVGFDQDHTQMVTFICPLRTRILSGNSLAWSKGAVMLRFDGHPHLTQQTNSTTRLLTALFLIIAIAAISAYGLLSYVVLRPVKQIASVTHRVAEGERSIRVNSRTQDELGRLAADVDAMLDELVRRERVEAQAKEEALSSQHQLESALAELACSQFALDQHANVAITDLQGVITYVNDKFCEISQYEREELIGQTHQLVKSGYHPESFWGEMWQTITSGAPWHGEVCNRAKDGSLHWVDTTIVPYKDQDGQVTKYVAIRTDITDRKSVEEKLRHSQERFELAVRGSNDGIWDWEIASGYVYYSARFKEHLGYNDNEFANDLNSFASHLHPDDAQATWQAVRRHFEDDVPYDMTYRLRTKAGNWRWFRAKGIAVRDSAGKPYRMAGSISDVSEIKRIEEQLARDATHDRLTGLPNRFLFQERVKQAMQDNWQDQSKSFAVLFLDFDSFKQINDNLGHDAGDELLRQIASRLAGSTDACNSVNGQSIGVTNARLGGDEFVVLLENFSEAGEVLTLAEQILTALAIPYTVSDQEVSSTASMGVLVGSPRYTQVEDVLRNADMAMYEAKRNGKGCYVVFDETLQQRMQRRLELEDDLAMVIQNHELQFEYEPIVALDSGAVQSLEAHTCWHHPVHGHIDTCELNQLAEDSGLASQLTLCMLDDACRQLRWWQHSAGETPATLGLNLTPNQFALPNLPRMVAERLSAFDVQPECLRLEITEAAFAPRMEEAVQQIAKLRELHVSVAIDHFGIGTSSFTSLHRLPVDLVKIDRSLLDNLQDSKQAASLIHGLAVIVRNLGISLVAVGIEKTEELIALQGLGCDLAQGSYFGPRMSAERMIEFLSTSTGKSLEVCGASPFALRWAEGLAGQALVSDVTWPVNPSRV